VRGSPGAGSLVGVTSFAIARDDRMRGVWGRVST
jgi:hypothetical protein